ncbi:ROK family transcriptional regulator [Niallia sp. 03190]|uniref:ROK family transcriptional regulator n=1 Tax=Niallia sp. 03190 TaxID=3458061 RepID=UPI004044463F
MNEILNRRLKLSKTSREWMMKKKKIISLVSLNELCYIQPKDWKGGENGGMKALRYGNRELMKDLNRSLVIDLIRLQGNISRTEIAKKIGLGLSTVTYIIEELLNDKLVYEIGTGDSNGGRKPVLLNFNGNYGVVAGVKIEKNEIKMCISNLEGTILHKDQFTYHLNDEHQLLSLLIEKLDFFIGQNVCASKLVGIGIAAPGLIDRDNIEIVYSPILQINHIDLKAVREHFGVPVLIDNDANVFALAEKWIGIGREYNNFIGITVGTGVGAGIVIDNRLFRGAFGGAGELGHIIIHPDGQLCYCGQRGCLEMYTSDAFLISEVNEVNINNIPTLLKSLTPIKPEKIRLAAQMGDRYAQEILVKQGQNLALGIKNMIHLFNPEAIILGEGGLRGGEILKKSIEKELAVHFFNQHPNKLQFHFSQLGEDVWLIGACALLICHLFEFSIYK